jgi:hypothetical protein
VIAKFAMGIASTVIISAFNGTHDHILLSDSSKILQNTFSLKTGCLLNIIHIVSATKIKPVNAV